MTKPYLTYCTIYNLFDIWEYSTVIWCSCCYLYPIRTKISCYLDQSDDQGCSIALHNSWLNYFSLSCISPWQLHWSPQLILLSTNLLGGERHLCRAEEEGLIPVRVAHQHPLLPLSPRPPPHQGSWRRWWPPSSENCCRSRGSGSQEQRHTLLGPREIEVSWHSFILWEMQFICLKVILLFSTP